MSNYSVIPAATGSAATALVKVVRFTARTSIIAASLFASATLSAPVVQGSSPSSSVNAAYVNTQITNVVLSSVGGGYALRKPIGILVRETEGEYVASCEKAELSRSGESPGEAIDWLRSSIVTLYKMLSKKDPKDLGPLPKRQLEVLGDYLVAEPDPKA
jgi:hypothetical protein